MSAFSFYGEFSENYLRYIESHKSVARPWDGFWTILVSDDVVDDDNWTLYLTPNQSQFMFVTEAVLPPAASQSLAVLDKVKPWITLIHCVKPKQTTLA